MIISIITLNYNKPDLTRACIASLYDQYQGELEDNLFEIIIVDNNSEDDSVEKIKNEIRKKGYKNIHLIENGENSGFGKGCNIGAASAKGEYLLFLNNDTVVQDRGFLKMAAYCNEHKNVSILGGQLHNADGTLQPSSGNFYTLPKVLLLLLGMQRFGLVDKSPSHITQVDWVKGGLLMIRSEIFKKLGGFDEKIFMYTEDMELCYRAKQAGFSTYFFPDIMVIHKEHGSTNKTFAIVNIYKNLLYFYKKHKSKGEYYILKLLLTVKAYLLLGVGRLLQKPYLVTTYQSALKAIS